MMEAEESRAGRQEGPELEKDFLLKRIESFLKR